MCQALGGLKQCGCLQDGSVQPECFETTGGGGGDDGPDNSGPAIEVLGFELPIFIGIVGGGLVGIGCIVLLICCLVKRNKGTFFFGFVFVC